MRLRRMVQVAAVGVLAALMSGCLWAPELDRVRRDIEKQLPGVAFKKEVALSLGPVALALAGAVVRLSPEARGAAAYLRDVRQVTVAVYEAKNVPPNPDVRLPKDLKNLLGRGGWELALKTSDRNEFVWVLCKTRDDQIKGLYVVVLDDDNLVLVRAHGRLENVIRKALSEHGGIADRV